MTENLNDELCVRCDRPRGANIHDVFGRQGTGTEAVHAFVGERESVILQYASSQLGWSKKSQPHAKHPTADMAQWNAAIDAAKEAVTALWTRMAPAELEHYDKYWGDKA